MASQDEIIKHRRMELIAERQNNSISRYMTSVGYALLATFTSYPFLRARVLMETRPEMEASNRTLHFTSYKTLFKHIWSNEGKNKFYRGWVPYFAFYTPYCFARQTAINSFTKDARDNSLSPINSFVRGFAATSISSIFAGLFTPFAIVANKLMADQRPHKRAIYEFSGPIACIRGIANISGKASLWTGALAFWFHHVTYFSTLFAVSLGFGAFGLSQTSPLLTTVAASIAALSVAQPFDTIRARMHYRLHTQVIDYVPEYRGMLQCARHIIKAEGVRALWRGNAASMCIYGVNTFWLVVSTARGVKNQNDESRNELLIQRRLQHSEQHRERFRKARIGKDDVLVDLKV